MAWLNLPSIRLEARITTRGRVSSSSHKPQEPIVWRPYKMQARKRKDRDMRGSPMHDAI